MAAGEQDAQGRSGNLLIAYRLNQYPLRETIRDHLYSFQRYSGQRCFYVNLATRPVPDYLQEIPFDAVIFHNSLLGARWFPPTFELIRKRAEGLKRIGGVRVALPQDEFIRTDQLSDFINEWEIELVCSVAPQSEWPNIYRRVDQTRTRFHRVLTGYLDESAIKRIDGLAGKTDRDIDIGYRARSHFAWLGRHGTLKGELGPVFERAATARGMSTDISTDDADVLLGDDWYRFLLSLRCTIGAEGGASILDRDGSLSERTARYTEEHPEASFDEIEAACFPGQDGSFGLYALSPRHLEACATGTCQILVEGDYNGILRANEHYIPLRRDLSNIDAVLDEAQSEERRAEIVAAARRDIVDSRRHTYESFVREVLENALGRPPVAAEGGDLRLQVFQHRARIGDRISALRWRVWTQVVRRLAPAYRFAYRNTPEPILALLRRLRGGDPVA